MVLSLSAKGLTHGEIAAHLAEVYGAEVSKQTISTITDKVIDGMAEWQNRPLDPVYPVVFIDAINVKIRDGQVANRPIDLVMAVTVDGHRDILGIWAGDGGEGAKHWLHVLTELKNRGVADVLMLVCDGLKGLPEAVETVWPRTIVQTCVVHLLRNSFRYAARQDWDKIAKALRPVYTAPTEDAATERFLEFAEAWGRKQGDCIVGRRAVDQEFRDEFGLCGGVRTGEVASVIMELRRFTTPRKTPPADGIVSHPCAGRSSTHLHRRGRASH